MNLYLHSFFSLILRFLSVLITKNNIGKMAENGGYDVECTRKLSAEYECGICLLILRQPVQTLCGHRFCRGCLDACFAR